MMNETEEMRQARVDLQVLSASDPAAGANMLKHVAAYRTMLTGKGKGQRIGEEPEIVAGFQLTQGDEELIGAAARESGRDCIYIAFDVDDAGGPPVAAWIFRPMGPDVMAHAASRLWSPTAGGRAVLVTLDCNDKAVHLVFRPGQRLHLVNAPPPGDLSAGVKRAERRMQALLSYQDPKDVVAQGHMHLIQNEGQQVFATSRRLAA